MGSFQVNSIYPLSFTNSLSSRPTSSLYWLTAGIIGPHLGGILGAWAYDWVLFYNDDKSKDNEESNDNKIELEKTVSTNDDSSKPFLVVKS